VILGARNEKEMREIWQKRTWIVFFRSSPLPRSHLEYPNLEREKPYRKEWENLLVFFVKSIYLITQIQ
jgi:hypothetical protein